MKRSLFILFFFYICFSAYSQSDTVYLDGAFFKAPKGDAFFYKVIHVSETPDERRTETTYYVTGEKYSENITAKNKEGRYRKVAPYKEWFKNGQLKEERVVKGKETSVTKWHDNGQVYYRFSEVNGMKEGEAVGYYPNGNLRRRENFINGKLDKGQCFKEDGTEVSYFPHFTPVEFPGGPQKMREFWGRNFRVPAAATRTGSSGTSVVQFQVDRTGKIGKIEIVKSFLPEVDREAIRVIKLFPPFGPATEEGEPINQTFTVPATVKVGTPPVTIPGTTRKPRSTSSTFYPED
ncbi:energy transducer TonB [Rufibacter ruber]|uniref:energy transducer TonB n=1 Tax=Rufibacter ruber TaxID=1783499 RepID=UPI0008306F18|nr:energy transducer TonB [Rufibacter ruber]